MAVTAQTLLTYLKKSGIKLAVVNGSLVVSTTSTRQPNAKEQAEIDSFQSELISILNTRAASTVSGVPEGVTYGVTGAPSRFQREQDQSTYNIVNTFNGNTGDVQGVSAWNGQTGAVTFNEYVSSWNGQTGDVTYVDINESTGILYGGQMSGVVGGTTFSVAAGVGQIVGYTFGSSGVTATITEVTWGDFSGLTIANLTGSDFTRVYIDSNGDLQQQTAVFTHNDPLDKIIIGTISHIDMATIALVTNKQITAYDYPHKVFELYNTFGPIKSNGLVVTANGTNLSLDRSAGEALVLGSNYVTDYEEPDGTDVAAETLADIARIYRDGSGDFIYDTNSLAFYSVVDPSKYDDNSGTLQTVNNNQYTIQRMYMFPNLQNVIMCYYGRVVYNSYSDALAGVQDEVFTEAEITANNAVFLGFLIVRGGATDLSTTNDAKIIQSGFCRAVPVGGGGGGGSNIYAGDGLTLGGGSTMSIDSTQVIHIAGISSDGGITAAGTGYFSGNLESGGNITVPTNSTIGQGSGAATIRPVSNGLQIRPQNSETYMATFNTTASQMKTVVHAVAGISADSGITFPDGTHQNTAAAGGGGGGSTYSVAFIIDGSGVPITVGHKVDALRQIPVTSTLTKSEIYSQDGVPPAGTSVGINLVWVDDLEQAVSGVTGSATAINLSGASNQLNLNPTLGVSNYYHTGTPTTPPSVTGGNWVYPVVTSNGSSVTKLQIFMSFYPS